MSEDTEGKEKTEEEEVIEPEVLTESQQQVKTFETVEERVKANQAKIDEANKVEEELKNEETGEPKTEPVKVKKPAHEVIRELKKERNEARTENVELKGKLSKLDERLEGIESSLASGRITQQQATTATEKVKDALDSLEIPEELEPYKDVLFKIAETIADKKIAPILDEKAKNDYETRLNQQKERWDGFVKKYPDLFSEKINKDGHRELLPSMDKEALEMAGYIDISDPKGVETILSLLQSKIGATTTEKAKIDKQIEAVKQSKETRVETSTVHPVTSKPKSVEDMVKRNMKNLGMEVR